MSVQAKPTILVVDDEPVARKLVCAMLTQSGYHALSAGSGLRALKMHGLCRPIDLLITEVVLRGMSGPALAERLANIQPGLKVLYISGYEHSRVVQKYVVEKGHELLPKPFRAEELEIRLRGILRPGAKSAAC